MSRPIRLAVVNDSDLVTAGVAALLAPFGDRVSVQQYVKDQPAPGRAEVALFDIFGNPDPELGLHALVTVSGVRVIVYSWQPSPSQLDVLFAQGASGFLSKNATAEEIVVAVEAVHAGKRVRGEAAGSEIQMRGWPGRAQGLTARESEIVGLIAAGHTNEQIAAIVFLSVNSIKSYIRSAYRTMGVTRRSQAVLWAVQNGLLMTDVEDMARNS